MGKKFLLAILFFFFAIGIATAGEFGGVEIHGFLAQGFLQTDKNNFYADTIEGTFEFNEAGINFTKQFTPKLRAGLQLFARDIGDYGNDEIILDWAYADYRYARWLGARAGKLRIPLSLYSETRDMDHLRTWILLPQGVYHEIRRDTFATRKGVELYGSTPRTIAGTFSYRGQAGLIDMKAGDGNSVFLEALAYPVWSVDNLDPKTSYLGRIDWDTPLDGLRLYGTYTEDKSDLDIIFHAGGSDVEIATPLTNEAWFGGLEYTFGDFVFAAEYFEEETLFTEFGLGGMATTSIPYHREGYYASLAYRFNEWFEAGFYYSDYDGDPRDEERTRKAGTGTVTPRSQYTTEEYCLTTRFDITPSWIFKLEVHRFEGTGILIQQDQVDLPDEDKTYNNWYLFAAKVSFAF